MCFSTDTGVPLNEEHVIAIQEKPRLRFEFHQRDVIDGMRSPWYFLVDAISLFYLPLFFPRGDQSCSATRKHSAACEWVGPPLFSDQTVISLCVCLFTQIPALRCTRSVSLQFWRYRVCILCLQHAYEGANLNQPCRQRDCVDSSPRHLRCVARGAYRCNSGGTDYQREV